MEKIFKRFKSPVAVLLFLILAGGTLSYNSIKTSLFPNITFPKIKIIANNGEQPVDKMMILVTKPLENAIKQVEHLRLIRSTTAMGSCEISAFMDWGSDINLDKQQVESRIAQIKNDLPPDVDITIEKMNPSILPVMGYSIQSATKDQIELKLIAEYTVKPYFSRIAGVAAVQVIGGKIKEYRIIPDLQKLKLLKINTQDIANAIEQTGFIKSNGFTVDYKRLYLTVTDARISNKEQLENLVIFNDAIRKVRVSDIALVTIAEQNEYVKIKADGKDFPLVAIVKQPTSNLVDVAKQVSEKAAELNKILPQGVVLKPYYNQSEFVQDSIKSIIDVLWIGLLLAILVVIVFLRSLKASSVLFITIPLTLALTFIVLYSLGSDFNIMTIGAIAASIGLIIDDAIIVIEQIHRTHEANRGQKSGELVGKAIRFLFPGMVSSSLSTIVILIPFELMTGVAGAFFKILTETMIITLGCSFFITWIGLPVIYLLFSNDKASPKETKHYKAPEYRWMGILFGKPYLGLGIITLLILCIIVITPRLQTGFLPDMDEGSIVLDYTSPPGTSLEETDRMLTVVDKIIESVPEVKTYSRRTGTQMGFYITEPNTGDYLIELKKKRTRTTDEVSDEIRKKCARALPALVVDFGQVITDMLGDLMTSVQPIEVKIFGNEQDKLLRLSRQVADSLRTIDGTADVFDGIVVAGPEIKTLPNTARLKQFGLTPSELQEQVSTYLEGTVVGTIPEKEQLTNIRMIFPSNNRTPLSDLKQLQICTAAGDYFPLSMFADFSVESGVAEIKRENLQSMGAVTARLNNRDLGGVMKDIQHKMKAISLPPSYQIIYGGSFAEQQNSFAELLRILISGGLLVFTVVLFMFRNLRLSLIVLFISLLGISGSALALYITHTPLNVGSYTGLIMIVGIIGENSIFTIHQYIAQMKTGQQNALILAVSARLRPNLMTALGAIVALTPLALGIGTGAQMHQPLAIAIIGGFVIALPLLLIVLPALLKIFLRKPHERDRVTS